MNLSQSSNDGGGMTVWVIHDKGKPTTGRATSVLLRKRPESGPKSVTDLPIGA